MHPYAIIISVVRIPIALDFTLAYSKRNEEKFLNQSW
jgi:hypothetical protein